MHDIVGVRFQRAGKVYSYSTTSLANPVKLGDQVVVETKDGHDVGQVVTMGPLYGKKGEQKLKHVLRRATPRDMVSRQWYRRREGDVLLAARKIITEQRIPVKIIKAEFSYDGKRLTLHLLPRDEKDEDLSLAPLNELNAQYKTHVQTRKIGPREASQLIGGHGLCGGEKCSTLTGVEQVSIDMAKQQNIAMNQPDAIGLCGRLRCCLRYEAETYREARANHPKVGVIVKTPQGKGEILSLDPLAEVLTIALGEDTKDRERPIIKMLLTELEQSDPDACPRCGKQKDAGKQEQKETGKQEHRETGKQGTREKREGTGNKGE
jgi:cell fate regulator YaaT (PSP1 superfamily)